MALSLIILSFGCASGSPSGSAASDGTDSEALRRSPRPDHPGRGNGRRDAGAPTDAGTPPGDSGPTTPTNPDAGTPPVDSGPTTPTNPDAGMTSPVDAGSSTTPDAECPAATRLWFDDFETGDHRYWTGRSYGEGWGNACETTRISTEMRRPGGGTYVQRSDNTCRSVQDVHRGYGGLQFSGDTVLANHTNTGTGFRAPNGIVMTEWLWLDAGYTFGNGRWVSLFSVFPDCAYNNSMITLGIDNPDGIMRPAHHWPQGVLTIERGAPAFPMGQWVRVTVHIDFAHGRMHVWQNGQKVLRVENITRSITSMCQFHWGLYSSGDNTDILMYEDDKSIWRLEAPLTDFVNEPWLDDACAP